MSLPPLPEPVDLLQATWRGEREFMRPLGDYFTADQMHAYAAAARLAALEEAAKLLDREHEARKHIDNHAAFYARKIRELATHVTPTCTDFGEK